MTDTNKSPRLRTVDKVKPPYQLNQFPADFGQKLGKEIVYLLATKSTPSLEGSEWEQIFASCIGAEWKPSNVGLDDVILGVCAWGAKTMTTILLLALALVVVFLMAACAVGTGDGE